MLGISFLNMFMRKQPLLLLHANLPILLGHFLWDTDRYNRLLYCITGLRGGLRKMSIPFQAYLALALCELGLLKLILGWVELSADLPSPMFKWRVSCFQGSSKSLTCVRVISNFFANPSQ